MKDAEDKKKAGKDGGEESDVDPFPGGKMTIYFGSQTGTAEEFAKTLEKRAKRTALMPRWSIWKT